MIMELPGDDGAPVTVSGCCAGGERAEQVTASALLTHTKHTHTHSCMPPVWIITVSFLLTKSRARLAESLNISTHHVCAQKWFLHVERDCVKSGIWRASATFGYS